MVGLGMLRHFARIAHVLAGFRAIHLVQEPFAVGFGELHCVGVAVAGDVVAGAEVFAFTAQHDHPHGIVVFRLGETGVEFVEHALVLGVGLLGTVQRDRGYPIGGLVTHIPHVADVDTRAHAYSLRWSS